MFFPSFFMNLSLIKTAFLCKIFPPVHILKVGQSRLGFLVDRLNIIVNLINRNFSYIYIFWISQSSLLHHNDHWHHDDLDKQLVDDIQLFTDCLDNERIHRTCCYTLHAPVPTDE